MSGQGREYAEDKVKQHINNNLSRFQRIQVKQMILLQCFTETDRQQIRATCALEGNNQAVFCFFQQLCCREGWVPLFIDALRKDRMGDLADELQGVYDRYLLPSPRTVPAAPPPPAASIPSGAPLRPLAKEQTSQDVTFPQAIRLSPLRFATQVPAQDTGDFHAPVQENSHPSEKSELAVKAKTIDNPRKPDFPPPSNRNAASNIRAAVGVEETAGTQVALPEKESSLIPGSTEDLLATTSTLDAGSVEQKWDGRQHRPVTVKNGCFGNLPHPEDNMTVPTLPLDAPRNQPEEDYYSSNDFSFALGGQREAPAKDLLKERRVHVIRGHQNQDVLENSAVVGSLQSSPDAKGKGLPGEKLGVNPKASHRSAGDPTLLPSSGTSPRSSSASNAHLSLKQTETELSSRVPDAISARPFHPAPFALDGSSSVETMPPNTSTAFSATRGDNAGTHDFKHAIEEKKALGETEHVGTLAVGQEQEMGTQPSSLGDRILHSYHAENDMPSKPGVLSSVTDGAAELTSKYSGTSERLCISSSDPRLLSDDSSPAGSPAANATLGSKGVNGTGDASLPPGDEDCEGNMSIRTYSLQVVEDPSMALMEAPEVAPSEETSWPSPRAFPDPAPERQQKKKTGELSGSSLPDGKAKGGFLWAASNPVLFFVGFALISVAAVAFRLYKKK